LDRGAASRLTLVSAPAGFGKTTLLAEWLAAGPAASTDERLGAWLSLDPGDNDSASFWTYAIAALRTVAPGVGRSALALLQASQPPPIETVLTTVINDLGAVTKDVVLVLDDYHVIDSRDVHEAMTFLLDHLPPRLHVVIASRADPALPLARLRARGELVEARAADLRFTPEEATAYLNGAMGLHLTAPDVNALEGRTEGWIAALQLAALSMQGRDDVASFIAGFAGDDRYIVDYLVEEVLQRLPDRTRAFLLQTSILGRLSGPLCDAVTGQDGGRATLEALDRDNLFLVPLDDRRRWYRYHHLFADVLRARLLDEQPGTIAHLHRRASEWFEQVGEWSEAIRHAMAGDDFERAADLIEVTFPETSRGRQEATVLGWLQALPDDVVRLRPVLSFAYAATLLVSGKVDGVESRLRDAERWLTPSAGSRGLPQTAGTQMVVVDEAAFRRLPSSIAVHRAGLALATGDIAATMSYARSALDLLEPDDHLGHGSAAGLIGLASWGSGDLDAAHQGYSECVASLLRVGHVTDVLGCSIALADIRIIQGRLRDAMRTYEQALQLALAQDKPVLRGTPDMHVGISDLLRERDDLEAAALHLLRSQELGEHNGMPQNMYRSRVAEAGARQAQGDLVGALDLLDQADRLYVGDFFPNVRPVPALKARVLVALGRLDDALGWVRDRGLSAEDQTTYMREFEHITLARILLARYQTERADRFLYDAFGLLDRLLDAADEGERTGSVIEILVLQAVAHQMHGDSRAGQVPLERALSLAEAEGYVRIFVDEGQRMASLLKAAARQTKVPAYVQRLVAAIDTPDATKARDKRLIEPLSERELDVLRLLGTDLGGPDIARELVVSLNTVRTHTKNIYAKLAVTNRRAAVRRGAELDLLSRAPNRPA
jgi:LuxR family maltose regulon positive regulatory protein